MQYTFLAAAQILFACAVFGIPTLTSNAVNETCARPANGESSDMSSFIQSQIVTGAKRLDELPTLTMFPELIALTVLSASPAPIEKAVTGLSEPSALLSAQLGSFREVIAATTAALTEAEPMDKESTRASYWNRHLFGGLLSWAIWVVLAFLVVHTCYTPGQEMMNQVHQGTYDASGPSKTFNEGQFNCLSDTRICFWSCVCIGIRWADTTSQAGFLTFWSAFGLFALLALLNVAIGGFVGFGIMTTCALLYYRQELRQKLEMPSWTFRTCFVDCCFVFWCPFCAVAQEARILKEARILNF